MLYKDGHSHGGKNGNTYLIYSCVNKNLQRICQIFLSYIVHWHYGIGLHGYNYYSRAQSHVGKPALCSKHNLMTGSL